MRPTVFALLGFCVLAGCGSKPQSATRSEGLESSRPGDIQVRSEENAARAAAERQANAAVAGAEAMTLEARVARLEAEVETLKTEAQTAGSLKAALSEVGASLPAEAPLPLPAPIAGPRRQAMAADIEPAPRAAPVERRPRAAGASGTVSSLNQQALAAAERLNAAAHRKSRPPQPGGGPPTRQAPSLDYAVQ